MRGLLPAPVADRGTELRQTDEDPDQHTDRAQHRKDEGSAHPFRPSPLMSVGLLFQPAYCSAMKVISFNETYVLPPPVR